MKNSDPPITVTETFSVSQDVLWNAITNVNEMRLWFFPNIPEFEARKGFQTKFEVSTGDRVFPHLWTILEVIPLEKIVYDWSYEGYEGRGKVTFLLEKNEDEVELKLISEVLEDFTLDIPEFKRESGVQGWTYLIKERLTQLFL